MLNLLPVLQIALDDSMSALAVLAMALAAFTAVSHALAWFQTSDKWRRAAYFAGASFGLYTAAAYAYVLFVDAGANVAWLRPAILAWMIHAQISKHTIETVASYDPDERCQRQTEQLEEQIADHLQSINILQHNNANYRDQLADMKQEREKAAADTTEIRKALEREKATLEDVRKQVGDYFEARMKAEERVNQLEVQVLRLGGQIDE